MDVDDSVITINGSLPEEEDAEDNLPSIVEEELLTIDIDKFIEEYSKKYDVVLLDGEVESGIPQDYLETNLGKPILDVYDLLKKLIKNNGEQFELHREQEIKFMKNHIYESIAQEHRVLEQASDQALIASISQNEIKHVVDKMDYSLYTFRTFNLDEVMKEIEAEEAQRSLGNESANLNGEEEEEVPVQIPESETTPLNNPQIPAIQPGMELTTTPLTLISNPGTDTNSPANPVILHTSEKPAEVTSHRASSERLRKNNSSTRIESNRKRPLKDMDSPPKIRKRAAVDSDLIPDKPRVLSQIPASTTITKTFKTVPQSVISPTILGVPRIESSISFSNKDIPIFPMGVRNTNSESFRTHRPVQNMAFPSRQIRGLNPIMPSRMGPPPAPLILSLGKTPPTSVYPPASSAKNRLIASNTQSASPSTHILLNKSIPSSTVTSQVNQNQNNSTFTTYRNPNDFQRNSTSPRTGVYTKVITPIPLSKSSSVPLVNNSSIQTKNLVVLPQMVSFEIIPNKPIPPKEVPILTKEKNTEKDTDAILGF